MTWSKGTVELTRVLFDFKLKRIIIEAEQALYEDGIKTDVIKYRIPTKNEKFNNVLGEMLPNKIVNIAPRQIIKDKIIEMVQTEIQSRKDQQTSVAQSISSSSSSSQIG